ncbi:MAG: acyl-CoA dehydrogenase family protein [Burkholderiaceae bacterium]
MNQTTVNETQAMIAESAQRLFSENVDRKLLDAFEEGQWPARLWELARDSGFAQATASEADGGIDATWSDVYPVLRGIGYWQVPLPLGETLVASWLLSRAGLPVPTGPMTIIEQGQGNDLRLTRDGAGVVIAGEARRVPYGRYAEHVLVSGRVDGQQVIALLDVASAGDALSVEPGVNIAREPSDTLRFRDARAAGADWALPGLAQPVWTLGALVRSAAIVGALESALEQAVAYANERVQFGKPIGKYQAVQQSLAQLAGETAAARMATLIAIGAAPDAAAPHVGTTAFDTAAAKVRAGEAASKGTSIAHQVHGAIGFTYEHSLHYATRRLWSWRAEFGSDAQWAERLGQAAIEARAAGFWAGLTQRALIA